MEDGAWYAPYEAQTFSASVVMALLERLSQGTGTKRKAAVDRSTAAF
jgi:hypothetical protein